MKNRHYSQMAKVVILNEEFFMLISGVLILANGKICFHNNVKKLPLQIRSDNRKKGFLIDFNLLSQHARL